MASIFDLSSDELNQLDPASKAMVKSIYNLRQSLWDMLGSYPQDNVLPYNYGMFNTVAGGNAIAANAVVQNSIKISADSAFVAMDVRGVSVGDLLFFPRSDASDRQYQNVDVHSSNYMGTAQFPGPLRKPLLLPANTTVSFNITDISGVLNQLYFDYSGFKIYNRKVQ